MQTCLRYRYKKRGILFNLKTISFNVQMIHFLWSVFFLILTTGLVLTYLLVGAILLACVGTLVQLIQQYRLSRFVQISCSDTWSWFVELVPKWRRNKSFHYIILLVLIFNVSLYCKQRFEWMGEDNGNLTAKEYWVAGQVVYGYRAFFSAIEHPDRTFIQPFTLLQEWICRKGVNYLPENDGERGVWTDLWFVYPYSKQMRIAMGSSGYKPSPRMIALVERSWYALEKEATGSWADYQMKTQHYFRNFPGQAFYYLTNKGFLTGKKVGSRALYTQDEHLLSRDRKLISWLAELPGQWQSMNEFAAFQEKNPKVDALRQITMVELSGDLVHEAMYKKTFTCDSREVQQYLTLREDLVGKPETVLTRMMDKSQAKTLYDLAVNTEGARFLHYSLKRFCNLEAAGLEDMKKYKGTAQTPEEWRSVRLRGLFPEETKNLEEIYHQ